MKTTITVPIITSQEVEVSLPQFRKEGNEYYAFFTEKDTDNIYLRLNGERLMCYMAWCTLSNISKGVEISEEEFKTALKVARYDLVSLTAELEMPTVTNDTQGDYYLTDEQKADLGSTAGEQTDDLGFQEFSKTN
jgi:hypothetical protein